LKLLMRLNVSFPQFCLSTACERDGSSSEWCSTHSSANCLKA
jgi:hypothetical protein